MCNVTHLIRKNIISGIYNDIIYDIVCDELELAKFKVSFVYRLIGLMRNRRSLVLNYA